MIKLVNIRKRLSENFELCIDELYIKKGDRVALIGSNGSGKSTLLKIIAGYISPEQGTVTFTSENIKTGYAPQMPFIFRGSTEKNIRLYDKKTNISELVDKCGLKDLLNKKASDLSGGEKQRMCFARMLMQSNNILLLDEPFSAADLQTSEKLCDLLKEICIKNDVTLIFSTHLPSEAIRVANKVLLLNNGKVEEFTDIDSLKNPLGDFGKKFIKQWQI